jgi:cyclic pyranopterin phosphate synthase
MDGVRYLRVSVTDRCNLRCSYCAPKSRAGLGSKDDLLSYEEIALVVAAAADLGVTKIRVTGGEPLVRRDIGRLLRLVSAISGPTDLALTTNGTLLREHVPDLLASRFRRVNVSLDTVNAERYRVVCGAPLLLRVVQGIDAAVAAGLALKLNAVCAPGLTVDEALALARFGLQREIDVRFIEAMPVSGAADSQTGAAQAVERGLTLTLGLEAAGQDGVARVFRVPGEKACIGFITPSHARFCSGCDKLRLSSRGLLRTCLFATGGFDLHRALRSGDRSELRQLVAQAIRHKQARPGRAGREVTTMVGIGG